MAKKTIDCSSLTFPTRENQDSTSNGEKSFCRISGYASIFYSDRNNMLNMSGCTLDKELIVKKCKT